MKNLLRYLANLSLAFLIIFCTKETGNKKPVSLFLKTGTDVLFENKSEFLKNKNIAVVANHSALLINKTNIVDSLLNLPGIRLKKIFSPEHGFSGKYSAGEKVENEKYDIGLISLYGKKKKPDNTDLKNIDLVIFDIQDIGVRFYTYISTLYYIIEACAKNKIPLMVLDRPNPVAFINHNGPITEKNYKSFISITPIPVIHSMTIGEIATLFAGEFIEDKIDLQIIKMENYKRDKLWNEYDREWIKPSPNIPDFETAVLYMMNSFIEGINVSEGRGTFEPFKQIGAPFINSSEFLTKLNSKDLSGLEISPVEFIPKVIPDMSKYPKFKNEKCSGIKFEINDIKKFTPLENAIKILSALLELYPEKIKFRKKHFDLLWGTDKIRKLLLKNDIKKIYSLFDKSSQKFSSVREKYILY